MGPNAGVRSSSKNLYDNREERKEARANAGAQVMAGGRNGTAGRLPPQGLNQFANAPQYRKPAVANARQNAGYPERGSIPMARGPSAERIQRHVTPTGMGAARQSRDRGFNTPFATQSGQPGQSNTYGGGPKIATTNTRLQKF